MEPRFFAGGKFEIPDTRLPLHPALRYPDQGRHRTHKLAAATLLAIPVPPPSGLPEFLSRHHSRFDKLAGGKLCLPFA